MGWIYLSVRILLKSWSIILRITARGTKKVGLNRRFFHSKSRVARRLRDLGDADEFRRWQRRRLFRTILHAISCLISEITQLPLSRPRRCICTYIRSRAHIGRRDEIIRFPFSAFLSLSVYSHETILSKMLYIKILIKNIITKLIKSKICIRNVVNYLSISLTIIWNTIVTKSKVFITFIPE
jgi:hypothetical protein